MEHKTVSLADKVFDRLEADILSGRYQNGQMLTELKLVEDMGVSRTPIREAVKRAEQDHIVEITGKGIKVLGVTKKDLEDIYAIRTRIEGLAAASAARNITDEQLAQLKEALELQEYYVNRHDPEHIIQMDSSFHELLYEFTGSSVLCYTLLPLHTKLQKYRKVSVEDGSRAMQSAKEHREIYEALCLHDEKQAEIAATRHVENARDHILQEA